MDEFIDHFFSSSSWSDNASATERSSLVSNGPSQTTRILSNSIGPHEGAEKYAHTSLISPSHTTDNLAAIPGTCLLIGDDSNSGFNSGLHPREARTKQEGSKRAAKPLLGLVDTNLKSGYLGLQLDSSLTSQGTLNYSSPKSLPVLGGLAKSTHAPPDCSDEISTNNPSGFQGSLRDAQGLPSIPHSWSFPPSYVSYPSHSAVMGQDKPQAFGLQGEHVDADATVPGNRFLDDDRFLHMDNLTRPVFGQDELHQNCLSSFDAGAHVTLTATTGLPSQLELSQMNEEKHYANPSPIAQPQPELSTAGGGCNGAIKPRVRARRGQATDPHSIAERLRREKIADRMKNLQEVVPNSNKTDKASMLDEIIDYVKFLQLQVKVLSMSRLGGAGAVVPLVTDSQTEGFCVPVVSPSDGQEAIHSEVLPLGPENNVAFEKEVAKLMDSNVTTAMQYLQSKGLCLMPIALASAISGWKPPSFSSTHGFGVHQLSSSSDSSEILGKDSTVAAAAAMAATKQ